MTRRYAGDSGGTIGYASRGSGRAPGQQQPLPGEATYDLGRVPDQSSRVLTVRDGRIRAWWRGPSERVRTEQHASATRASPGPNVGGRGRAGRRARGAADESPDESPGAN